MKLKLRVKTSLQREGRVMRKKRLELFAADQFEKLRKKNLAFPVRLFRL